MKKLQAQGKEFDIVNARFVKPLDTELLQSLTSQHIVTIEDNVMLGGFGCAVTCAINQMQKQCKVKNYAYRDEFITQGKITDLQAQFGVNCEEIYAYIQGVI